MRWVFSGVVRGVCQGVEYIMGLSCTDSITNVNIAMISGVVLQRFTVGSIAAFFAQEEEIRHNLAEAFVTAQMAGYPVSNLVQVCAGVAGIQGHGLSAKTEFAMRDVMRCCGYTGDALLCGDEQIALVGALDGKKGAILFADKTSMCYGKTAVGASHRTGGMGILADDDGSAYAIGREILRAVARAGDGRGKPTQLTGHVYRKFGLAGQGDLTRFMRSCAPTQEQICELADCLAPACQVKDKVALGMVDSVVDQLASLVEPVVKRLFMQKGTLAVAGKVLLNDAFVGLAFKKRMAEMFPGLCCVPPRHDEVMGAVLLAKERLALRGYVRG